MGETVTFTWPTHGQQLCKGLLELLRESFETDFQLYVKADNSRECQMLKVHHVVLAIFCPLLRNVTDKTVILGNYNVEDLKCLVEFIYTGKTSVKKAGLASLRQGANAIGLKSLVNSIDSYVRRQKTAKDSQDTNNTSSMSNQSSGTTADDTQSEDTRPKKAQSTSVSPRKPTTPVKSGAAEIKSRLRPRAETPVKSTKTPSAESPVKSTGKTAPKSRRPRPPIVTCKHCSYCTDHLVRLITHMAAIHHVDEDGNKLEKTVKCDLCSYTCYIKQQLGGHRHLKHNKNPRKCKQCPYVCGTRAEMRTHMSCAHSDERPFMCELCGLRFKVSCAYTTHLKRHKKLRTNCEVCGKTVALMSLRSHMDLHNISNTAHACHLCSFAARKRSSLKVHLLRMHKVHMEKQGKVLGKGETSLASKSIAVHSSADDNSEDCAEDLNSNTD